MSYFDEIVSAVKSRQVVLFLGAGIHYHRDPYYTSTGRPRLAGELATDLAADSQWAARFPGTTYPPKANFTRVTLDYELFIEEDRERGAGQNGNPGRLNAQAAREKRSRGRTRLRNTVSAKVQAGINPSPLLKVLAKLGFPIIVTTNYDTHYEDTLISMGGFNPYITSYHPKRSGKENDFPRGSDPSPAEPFIFKIHGDISDPQSLVITDEDYIDFVIRMTEGPETNPVPSTINYRMSRWPTLFLGYSLMDYNLRLLLKTLYCKKDQVPFKSYAVSPNPDPLIARVWEDEQSAIGFVEKDVWDFIPELYQAVTGQAIDLAAP